jgi:4'-phosphopantetheinyl transferase
MQDPFEKPRTRIGLERGEVHVWFVDPAVIRDPALLRTCAALLSVEERERLAGFRFPEHRHLHLIAHAFKRQVLSRYADVAPEAWCFARHPLGRPEIVGAAGLPPLRFSLSHGARLATLAVTLTEDIGVDVECATRAIPSPSFARRVFAEPEYRDWLAQPPEGRQSRFFEYWTLKEAYLKATGLGLSIPTDRFAFRLGAGEEIGIEFGREMEDDPGNWSFRQFSPGAGHHAALAVRGPPSPGRRVLCRRGEPLFLEPPFHAAAPRSI